MEIIPPAAKVRVSGLFPLVAQMVKTLPGTLETQLGSLGMDDPSENPMDRGAWWTTVCGITKSWTRLSE